MDGGAIYITTFGCAACTEVRGNTICNNVGGLGVITVNNTRTSRVLIRDNTFAGNVATNGTVFIARSTADIQNNVLDGNRATWGSGGGGAMHILQSTVAITGNLVVANAAAGRGGGIFARMNATGVVSGNTFVGNSGQVGGGALSLSLSSFQADSNVFWNNTAPIGSEVDVFGGSDLTLSHSVLQGGTAAAFVGPSSTLSAGPGLIDADPQFRGRGDGDFRLTGASPCVDAGAPGLAPPDTELGGNPRRLDGDLDGVIVVDIGAYEFNNVHVSVTGSVAPTELLTIEVGGTAGLEGLVVVGTDRGATAIPGLGALFVSLSSPWDPRPGGGDPDFGDGARSGGGVRRAAGAAGRGRRHESRRGKHVQRARADGAVGRRAPPS